MKRNKPKYKQIIDAAVIVIAENGYHQAQVSKIAKQAGVADGTIYLYFKNKEDILISLFKEKMGLFVDKIEEVIAGKQTVSEKLLVMIENHCKILSDDHHLAIVTQLELRQSNKEIRLKINDVLKGYLKLIDTILVSGVESGEFSADLDVRLARQMIFGTLDEMVTTWVMNEQKYDLTAQVPTIHKLLLQGCGGRNTISLGG
ncbi:TetR/AcrR family transcriptional regulator [Rossellomorea marisflavi]|uniref:TetR family transcriptional regulator n=1 Tax=Rossellomorea marisflavi TaxID=189381 RepID=A0A0J5V9C6_9BACI|nr:TetR/AcrR family transcriptional regulator [Rossellomorea marisflavi]KMK94147.1 TetR family transcriptional regulator [Rossellomorea marisflavi]KML07495.1 TetR family transcriptional regulator [Rossellomorea marisflavi]KML34517.1 TetR family transcriptional regulator [Rossellomorea marisflavi]KZE43644.1 TetR family transcriptional regulator [Rossellomorea marisflavi]TYO73366.1 TetR/AcrR family transcriptional regulator [Rossellomorea marisflavi]